MKKITDSIEVAISGVHTAFPSIFSKEDVVGILEGLHSDSLEEEVKPSGVLFSSEDYLDNLLEKIKDAVALKLDRLDVSSIVDFDSAEFSLGYDNRVSLDTISVNADDISEKLNCVVEDVIRDYVASTSNAPDETKQ